MQLPRAPVALRGYARVGKIGGNEERETSQEERATKGRYLISSS